MAVLPNTDTDMVNQLVTTEFGNNPFNAYQVKNTAPYVYGLAFEGDTVTEDAVASPEASAEAPVEDGAVVSPDPVDPPAPVDDAGLSAPGIIHDVEHDADVVIHDVEAEAEKLGHEAEDEAKRVETEVVDEAEKVPGFAERIVHDIENIVDGGNTPPAPAPPASS
jgi:hypothetical protein